MIDTALSILDGILKIADITHNADIKLAVANLKIELAGIKTEAASLKEANLELNTRLKELIETPLSLSFGIYYDTEGNPFCPTCYGLGKGRIPLQDAENKKYRYQCHSCRGLYSEIH